MKASFSLPLRGLSGFLCLFVVAGCINKPPARPSQLYSKIGNGQVGGDMRLAADRPVPRNPPRLPIIVKDSSVDADNGKQPPPPPPPTLSSSAVPTVISPVPGSADGYFGAGVVPAPTSVLGGLFDSIFVPPTPPTPTTSSSAKYQEVK